MLFLSFTFMLLKLIWIIVWRRVLFKSLSQSFWISVFVLAYWPPPVFKWTVGLFLYLPLIFRTASQTFLIRVFEIVVETYDCHDWRISYQKQIILNGYGNLTASTGHKRRWCDDQMYIETGSLRSLNRQNCTWCNLKHVQWYCFHIHSFLWKKYKQN
jgi:hypothetical protein